MKKNTSGKRVIYIMGAGRSGTTITDIVLGNAEGIESLGEIFRFAELRGIPHGFGPDSEAFLFWKKVKNQFLRSSPNSLKKIEGIAHSIEYHSNFFKTYLGINSKRKVKEYSQYVNLLFDTIFESYERI